MQARRTKSAAAIELEKLRAEQAQELEDLKSVFQQSLEEHKSILEENIEGLRTELRGREEVWKLKREALLRSLRTIDQYLSQLTFQGVKPTRQEKPFIADIRDCANRLATTCESDEPYKLYLKVFLPGDDSVMEIYDRFRNSARRELQLQEIDFDPETTWLAQVSVANEGHAGQAGGE